MAYGLPEGIGGGLGAAGVCGLANVDAVDHSRILLTRK
jgi:hypothetical protein